MEKMRKRDRLRAKRDRMWEKMDENKARLKASQGVYFLIAMLFVAFTFGSCDADAKSSPSRSSTKSYTRTAPKPAQKMNLSKNVAPKPVVNPVVNPVVMPSKKVVAGTVVAGAATTAVVVNSQQSKSPATTSKVQVRTLKKGMYERNGYVCKKDWRGKEKCKSKLAYYYDDVLDADDWFEDDGPQYQQTQPVQQSDSGSGILELMIFFGFIIIVLGMVLMFFRKRK